MVFWFTPKCPQPLRLWQVKARSPNVCPAFPRRWQGPKCVHHSLLPPRGAVAGNWNVKLELRHQLGHSENASIPSSSLTTAPNICLEKEILKCARVHSRSGYERLENMLANPHEYYVFSVLELNVEVALLKFRENWLVLVLKNLNLI